MVRAIVDAGEFSRLADNPKVSLADPRPRPLAPHHHRIKDYVSLNAYAA